MKEKLTKTIEDYLKAIYEITKTSERASTNQIAESLCITPASVTGMIKKLSSLEPPLVEYRSHYGVILTEEGQMKALEVIRHHRLLEMFLHQILGYEWDEVHAEADMLEHVISEDFEERIAKVLGNPTHDPHGDPIPDEDLQLPLTRLIQLTALRPGQEAIIQRVNDSNSELLRHLSLLGLIPKTKLSILDYSPFDKNIHIRILGNEKTIVLGPDITRKIYVEII
jgi:DtxR family transcriptional regulator, Mn-dependent transcriptional regulator